MESRGISYRWEDLSGHHSPDGAMKLSTILMAGRQLNPPLLRLPMGGGGGKLGVPYLRPKDSNTAVRVSGDHATQKSPEVYDRQTDIQTNKLSAHYSKMLCYICRWLLPWKTGISEGISIQTAEHLHANT